MEKLKENEELPKAHSGKYGVTRSRENISEEAKCKIFKPLFTTKAKVKFSALAVVEKADKMT